MGYRGERYFMSNKGFHVEFTSQADAQGFYQDAMRDGSRVEIQGNMVIMLTSNYAASQEENQQ